MSPSPAALPLVRLAGVSKWYGQGPMRTLVLAEASFTVHTGESVGALGPSGSGKTTLLNLLGAMDEPRRGSVVVRGAVLERRSPDRCSAFCRDAIGLGDRARVFPSQLSGGQQQRVAAARALAKEPLLVIADESPGNPDHDTGRRIVGLTRELNRRSGAAFVVVTRYAEIAKLADGVEHIDLGRIAQG